jgi:hypothetical protein
LTLGEGVLLGMGLEMCTGRMGMLLVSCIWTIGMRLMLSLHELHQSNNVVSNTSDLLSKKIYPFLLLGTSMGRRRVLARRIGLRVLEVLHGSRWVRGWWWWGWRGGDFFLTNCQMGRRYNEGGGGLKGILGVFVQVICQKEVWKGSCEVDGEDGEGTDGGGETLSIGQKVST